MHDRLRDLINNFKDVHVEDIVTGEKVFSFQEVRQEIAMVLESVNTINSLGGYIVELPDNTAEGMVNELEPFYNLLNEIKDHKYDSQWLTQYYEDRVRQIRDRYRQIYPMFIVPVRNYANSVSKNTKQLEEYLQKINQREADLESKIESATKVIDNASDVTSQRSTVELSKHFESLVGGPIQPWTWSEKKKEYQAWRKSKKREPKRYFLNRFFKRVLLLTKYICKNTRKRVMKYEDGYEQAARAWFYMIIAFIILTFIATITIKSDFDKLLEEPNKSVNAAAVLVKLLYIAAPLYALRFSIQNFSANKHLAVISKHRSVVMQTVLAYLSRNIDDSVKAQIMVTAAQETFSSPESGYLSKDKGSTIEQNVTEKIFKNI